ncbi:hypothetical protein FGU71_13120 [Erythrobacter insulae]|uniref:Uncharacterized protein n=1 Tax=Erythrobacter insulae TaxID=2584124 RepID=A0A547P721_9SPHN|nr:hypothetical protein [Erythrobacter insulae]TRD09940.1 hypothetical protein FGU71_13120 [Erythrobacter insulae]
MFRANAREETYQHRTAFYAGQKCVAEIKHAADRRGFKANVDDNFAYEDGRGYREVLIFGSGQSKESGAFEWERVKE